MAVALLSSLQLWLSAQDQAVKIQPRVGEELVRLLSELRSCWRLAATVGGRVIFLSDCGH